MTVSLRQINQSIVVCTRCPELRRYAADIGREKRRAFQEWRYHAAPVPGFGDPKARLWIIGLAPAAHGANRTGRMFTGDRSGDFLYAALHRAGLANQPTSVSVDDGLRLRDVYISAALRCAPPGNRPTLAQLALCRSYLVQEWGALRQVRVILALGGIGWNAALAAASEAGVEVPRPKPKFGHGAEVAVGARTLLGCYHVSQQNTFTGRLTEAMIDEVLGRARHLVEAG